MPVHINGMSASQGVLSEERVPTYRGAVSAGLWERAELSGQMRSAGEREKSMRRWSSEVVLRRVLCCETFLFFFEEGCHIP